MPGKYIRLNSKERKEKLTSPQKNYVVIPGGALPKGVSINKASRMIETMNLSELLEASKIVDMRARGEAVPIVVSPKAEVYAGEVLKLARQVSTRPMAENMMNILTEKILETNKLTTNQAKSKKLYRRLMAEE